MEPKVFDNPWGPIPGRVIYKKMTIKRQLFSKKRQANQYHNPTRPALKQ
jgi:hypothetical protein